MSTEAEQLALARRLTVAQMEAMERSIARQDRQLAKLARKAIAGMKRAHWSWQQAEIEIDKLFSGRQDIIATTIRDELKDSAAVSKRVMGIYKAYQPTAPIVTEAEIAAAQQAAAPVVASTPSPLSKTLHGETVKLKEATKSSVKRSLREFRNSDLAGKDLIQTARASGTAVGNVEALPKALNNYVQALKGLDPEDIADTRKQLNRYMKKLVDKRMGYREFAQIIDQQGPAKLEKAVARWIDEKQRYHAERITRTEMAAEHRQRQLDQWRREKRVVGVVWTLNGGSRRGFVRRTPVPKSGKSKGSRCPCEANAGKEFTLQYAADHTRMGHPHCKCFWVPVYAAAPKKDGK